MEPLDKVILYGVFDGLNLSSDGSRDILVTLENGDRVDIPQYFVRKASDFVEKDKIRLKDVIARIKAFGLDTQKVWLNEILNELGSDYGASRYKDGYEQGKVESLIEREKVQIPKLVAEEIERFKEGGDWDLFQAMDYSFGNNKIREWLEVKDNQEIFARAWLDGYTVEKEKRYLVKMKGMDKEFTMLKLDKIRGSWYLGNDNEYGYTKTAHTYKELEEAGFGEVLNSPLFEVEEVD